jgi:D-beta-D-heptose 7-phosphate kinase/D-beta-D-heptose 1-phosphate adenosyltransferase
MKDLINRLNTIILNMPNKKVLVIGDLMLDEYIFGNVERISPEAPVPILDVKEERLTLGGAGNVIKNLKSLDTNVTVCSIIGLDYAGEKVLKTLNSLGVNTNGLFINQMRKTSKKTRIIAGSQQIVRIDHESKETIKGRDAKLILDFIEENIKDYDAIIISDYAKGVISKDIIDICVRKGKEYNIPINVDPKEKNYLLYKGVNTITPNLKELANGSEIKIENEETLNRAIQITFDHLLCETVLLTRGSDGMSVYNRENPNGFHIPTFAKKVFDVTGAGDTVISVYTLALISGANEIEAAYIANAAAGYVVGEIGAASIDYHKLYEEVADINLEDK